MNKKCLKEMNGYFLTFIFLMIFIPPSLHAQNTIPVSGKVIDDTGYEIPFAAIGIVSKNIGTTSTEDGTFYFQISKAILISFLYFIFGVIIFYISYNGAKNRGTLINMGE